MSTLPRKVRSREKALAQALHQNKIDFSSSDILACRQRKHIKLVKMFTEISYKRQQAVLTNVF